MKMSLRRQSASGAAVFASLFAATAIAGPITFSFDYTGGDPSQIGFDNPVSGAARRASLEQAGALFSDYFGSIFSNSGTIVLKVESTNTPLPGTLAYAGSNGVGPLPGFGTSEVVHTKLVNGVDINGADADGVVGVNWGAPWELNPNTSVATPPLGNFDYFAALFHEFTHALGFSSSLNLAGTDASGNGRNGTPGEWSAFDRFLSNSAGSAFIDEATLFTNGSTYDAAVTSGMFFDGDNAVAAYGGLVPIYSPDPYLPGSSGSHLDTNIFTTAMMKHDRDFDIDEARTYNAVEIGILRDIGYVLVPEPTSLSFILIGVSVLGRRRTV